MGSSADGAAELAEIQLFIPVFVTLGLTSNVSQGQKGNVL